jgi:hypothetical protein
MRGKKSDSASKKRIVRPALRNDRHENVAALKRRIDRPVPDWRVEQREIERRFKERDKALKVEATTRTASGHVLDWVQPTSLLGRGGGRRATPPPVPEMTRRGDPKRPAELVKFELEMPGAARGPAGTVPILRRGADAVRVSTTASAFLSKHGQNQFKQRFVLTKNSDGFEVPGDGAHDYAYTAQFVTCYGGEGSLAAYDPYTQWSDEFSLLQILLRRGNQTIEAGWQEYRDMYGDWVPHLFVYYTTNGYSNDDDNQGGYNRDVDGWVQYSSTIYPGAVFSPTSVRGGSQYMMQIKYQLYQGNWWFCCNGQWVGYYPASLFNDKGLRDSAEKIAFYGEIVDSSDHSGLTNTDMSSGYWPEYHWPWAGYLHNLKYQSDPNGALSDYNAGVTNASDPDEYDLETHMLSGSTWESYFWLGGPGAG